MDPTKQEKNAQAPGYALKEPARTIVIVFACVLVNFAGSQLAGNLELPFWMDCFGTMFAAYVLGPISGAIVGITNNIIYSFWNPMSLIYMITSVFIGLTVGHMARKKYFESFFGVTTVAGGVTLGSVLISTVLNLLIWGGSVGNVWGDGVRNYLIERGVPGFLASGIGQLYLEFFDKLITVLLLYLVIRISRRIRKRRDARRGTAVLILLALLLTQAMLFPGEAHAAIETDYTYNQQIYNADSGLPGGHANDVVMTNDGILWIGANSGLYRYSGTTFRFMEEFDTVRNVNCLYVDQEGRLWIGTNDNGLVLSINGKAANTLDGASGLPSDSVHAIVQNRDGDYYVGTAGATTIVRISIGITVTAVLPEVRGAECLTADAEGNVAAVTSDGRLFLLREQKVLREITDEAGEAVFTACSFDESGLLWAGTSDGTIRVYRIGVSGPVEARRIKCEGVQEIHQIFFHGGNAWILAENGIGTLKDDAYRRFGTGTFDSSILRMTVDYQGNLWFASTEHGLLQLSQTSFPNLSTQYGLPAERVRTTAIRDGLLYIGSDSGLSTVDLRTGEVVRDELTELIGDTPVSCILADSSSRLWIATLGQGLIRRSHIGEIQIYRDMYGINSDVTVLAELSDGTIAAGTDRGFAVILPDGGMTILSGGGLEKSNILTICEHPDGSVLLGTDGNGIVVVRDGDAREQLTKSDGLTSGVVRRIVPDAKGSGLFLVTGNGLCYMEGDRITPISGFPYSDNYDIVQDDSTVFVLGSAGIHVVNREAMLSGGRFDYTLLNYRSGLQGSLTENARNALTEFNRLFLSTDRGVVLMNLDTYRSEKRSYRLTVSEIRLDGRAVPIERGSGLTIGRDVETIEFIPEIVNYTSEDPNISYYLEGFDTAYRTVPLSELAGVVYKNIPSGEYTFHLAILNENGRIWEESTYGFVKEKSIQDNSWFPVYLIIVGGLFIGWLTWFITRISVQQTIAIQQERLALALKQVQMGNETILAIARTVDAKDLLTSKHSQRVSEYSVLIAKRFGFSEEEQENLRKAALLHDIGKIGIPDSILNKPDRLTDEEYAIMKTHVTNGAEILKDFTLIDHVVEGARYHHERYDGKGYPDGLKGREIPLYGRIIAVADAFDAMTANRVYRKRLPFADVLNELRNGRGTQFDPELLDDFLNAIESGEIDVESLYAEPKTEAKNGEGQTNG